jgi:membrane peptidoglycan carboxypeptidase
MSSENTNQFGGQVIKPKGKVINVNPVNENANSTELIQNSTILESGVTINPYLGSESKISHDEITNELDKINEKSAPNKEKKGIKKRLSEIKKKIGLFYKKHKTPINITLTIFGVGAIVIGTYLSFWLIDVWNNQSNIENLGQEPSESSVVYAKDGTTEIFRYYDEENREVVELSEISPNMQMAIIALEDEKFYYNENGIPWSNLVGASFQCAVSTGDNCRGASGLSQQLIKNVKKDDEGTIKRKVRELFTAIKLNQTTTKDEILEKYLNWVPFGRNAYGIEQASKAYFNKPAKDLSINESCFLASMVQRPSYFNSGLKDVESKPYKDLQARINACLAKLSQEDLKPGETRLIANEEELKSFQEIVVTPIPQASERKYPHFADYVDREITKFVSEQDLLTGGFKIITSIDPAIQESTQATVTNRAQNDIIAVGGNNAAVIVLDGPTSQVVAMVGSLDYNNTEIDGQVNVALAPRQPGSSIKPYVYAASFEKGLSPATVLADVRTTFDGNYTPKNFSGGFVGEVSIRKSLANSYNIPAVKAAYLASGSNSPDAGAGINNVFNLSQNMGVVYPCIESSDGAVCQDENKAKDAFRRRCGISSSLGGCEVSMISHATGINTFAQDGKLKEATPFISIVNKEGRDIYKEIQDSPNPVYKKNDNAVDPKIAKQINSILSDYGARRDAFGASASRLELAGWNGANAVAAKTGTTNDIKDTWTVGYSPYYTVTVWAGNTDGTQLSPKASSIGTTSGIWNDIMVNIHQNKEKKGFNKEGLRAIRVDPKTGLASEEEGSVIEYFTDNQASRMQRALENLAKDDYKPRENVFFNNMTVLVKRKLKINKTDELIAVDGKTIPENIEEREFLELIPEYSQWGQGVQEWMDGKKDVYKPAPTELSQEDQVSEQNKEPEITTNLDSSKTNVESINVTVKPNGNNKTITSIEILINGESVAKNQNLTTLNYSDLEDYYTQNHTVLVRTVDSAGKTAEKSYTAVTFRKPTLTPLATSDLASLSITCEKPNQNQITTSCNFKLPAAKSLPYNLRIRIGELTASSCALQGSSTTNVICNGVQIPEADGNYGVFVRVVAGEGFVKTAKEFEISRED